MKTHDFLICAFHGDVTVYVAEVLKVLPESFECRFVHSESRYTFSLNTWAVLKTTGAFRVGTLLTSHELYTPALGPLLLNSFVSVTFANGKSYLGRLIAQHPHVVRFLHKGLPIYVFENNKIVSSGGIYPKGQSIININPFELANQQPKDNGAPDLSQKGISYNGAAFQRIASEIQGNIVKSHGRDHSSHILFRFNPQKQEDAKAFISEFAVTKLTSAWKQKQDSDKITTEKKLAIQENRNPKLEALQTMFISLLLSAEGYQYLNLDLAGFEQDFRSGMKNANLSSTQMFDRPAQSWETTYQNEIHGMILVAWGAEDRTKLDIETDNITARLRKNNLASVLGIEKGDGQKNANGDHVEHFGYVDGISQPKFFNEELSELKEQGVDTLRWNPLMPLDLVLTRDPLSENLFSYGSYFVFRKLQQHTQAFREAVIKLAGELFTNPTSDDMDWAGAMIVGRFKNGVPLTLSNSNKEIDGIAVRNETVGKINDFDYSRDADGSRCPLHAHVRKTNPRIAGNEQEKRHMMARRGISYKQQTGRQTEVGLLFMSFQSSIFQQFQHQQEVFANDHAQGKDPVIGQGDFENSNQRYAPVYGNKASLVSAEPFHGFVTLKGGEYFFAPSMQFLRSIGQNS